MTLNFHSNTEAHCDLGICIEGKFCFLLRKKGVETGRRTQREKERERERESEMSMVNSREQQ